MKTKIVYVLVSDDKDFYLEQAWVSILSVRHHMKDAHISLLIDTLTADSFIGLRKEKAQVADEVVVVELDRSLPAQKRSRLLKTNVRNHIKGDYLFIDTDTIITQPLSDIDLIESDIAACWDSHSSFDENPYRQMCLEHGKRLGWPIEKENEYFNSGVMYVKDNEHTRAFYKQWHQNYLEGYDKGVSMDQPSLAKTNYEFGHIICDLSCVWNCQFKHGMRFLKEAKIVHYLTTSRNDKSKKPFLLNDDTDFIKIKCGKEIRSQVIDLFDNPEHGIPDLTLLLAGQDITAFRNRYVRRIIDGSKRRDLTYIIISFICEFSMFVQRVVNKIKTLI